jgi:hypothetical protein
LGVLSPYNTIQELQTFASCLAIVEPRPAKIVLSDDLQTLTVNGKPLSLQQWRSGTQRAMQDMEDLIMKVLKGKEIPFTIPDDIMDDMTDTTMGYSWLNNAKFTEDDNPLLKCYLNDPDSPIGYQSADGHFHFHVDHIMPIMETMAQINKLHCFLSNQVNSQAIRGTSLADLRLQNAHRHRNHHKANGETHHIIQYTKTTNNREMDIYLPVLMNPVMRRLDDMYLILLRPLEKQLAFALWGEDAKMMYEEFMYVQMGQRVDEKMVYKQFPKLCKEYFNVELNLSDYRDWAIGVMREYIAPEYRLGSKGDMVGDLMAQHGSWTAEHFYALLEGGLPYITTEATWQNDQFCHIWHDVSGFGSNPPPLPLKLIARKAYVSPVLPVSTSDGLNSPEALQMLTQILNKVTHLEERLTLNEASLGGKLQNLRQEIKEDVQDALASGLVTLHKSSTTHSISENTAAAEDIQDALASETSATHSFTENTIAATAGDDVDMDDMYLPTTEPLSLDQSLYMDTPLTNQISMAENPIKLTGSELEQSMAVNHMPSGVSESTALRALHTALGRSDATWRSPEQRATILHTLDNSRNIISVMKTGMGKSMTWILAALLQTIICVVIVPFHDLLEQHLSRAKHMGCRAMKWTAKSTSINNCNLIFMAMETAASSVLPK